MTKTPAPLSLRVIAVVAAVIGLALGREFFIPIALALCFHALLRPVVRWFEKLHMPAPAGAAAVVLSFLGLLVVGGFALSGPISDFTKSAPASIAKARARLRQMGSPLQRVSDAATGKDSSASAPAPNSKPAPATSQPSDPAAAGAVKSLLGGATSAVVGLLTVLVLLYLMLAAGNLILRKLVKVVPGPDDKRTVADVFHETESIVSRYIVVTALINVGQGVAVGFAMWAIGMPSPLMWGLLTFVMEFIPYLGGAINVGLLLIIGFTEFTGTGRVLLAPALYLVITMLQNNVISPYAYGSRLKLSPLAVMVCVMFWWFVWGIPGVFLAIPIAATLKVLGDQVPRLAPLGELLGD